MRKEIDEIIETLQGTCMSLNEGIQTILGEEAEFDDLTDEELEHIDSEIFLCESCGWWCELSEMSDEDEGNCQDCV